MGRLWRRRRLKRRTEPERPTNTGRGLMTRKPISEGDTLISLPEPLLVNATTIADSFVGPYLIRDKEPLTMEDALTLFVITECLLGSKSAWQPYIQILPESFTIPIDMSAAEQQNLPYHAKLKVLDIIDRFEASCKRIRPILLELITDFNGRGIVELMAQLPSHKYGRNIQTKDLNCGVNKEAKSKTDSDDINHDINTETAEICDQNSSNSIKHFNHVIDKHAESKVDSTTTEKDNFDTDIESVKFLRDFGSEYSVCNKCGVIGEKDKVDIGTYEKSMCNYKDRAISEMYNLHIDRESAKDMCNSKDCAIKDNILLESCDGSKYLCNLKSENAIKELCNLKDSAIRENKHLQSCDTSISKDFNSESGTQNLDLNSKSAIPNLDLNSESAIKDLIAWAWCSVNSRCLYKEPSTNKVEWLDDKGDNAVLAMFLDLFNHSPYAEVEAGYNEDTRTYDITTHTAYPPYSQVEASYNEKTKTYDITTHTAYPPYSQVFFNYGPHDNTDLFVEYGFVVPDNFYNVVIFEQKVIKEIAEEFAFVNLDAKMDVIDQFRPMTCCMNGASYCLLVSLRILTMSYSQFKNWKVVMEGDPICAENEEMVTRALSWLLNKRLQHNLQKQAETAKHESRFKELILSLWKDEQIILEHCLHLHGVKIKTNV